MKTSKIELLHWLPHEGENIEVDWPKVHRTIGLEHTKWLLGQDPTECQVVLERKDMYCRLIAEFYNERILATYYLMWAK
jgi:hypothetical protein